jgi:membrane protease YdiL (CAAX protease family)
VKQVIFPDNSPRPRQVWVLAIPVLLPAFFIVAQVLSMLPVKLTGLITRENVEAYPYFMYFLIVSFACTGLAAMAWVKWFERRSVASLGLVFNRVALGGYGRGIALGVLYGSAVVLSITLAGGYVPEDPAGLSLSGIATLGFLLSGFMVQSGVEELVFRGWAFSRIAARYGIRAGVLGNAALFTLLHLAGEDLAGMGALIAVIFTTMCVLFSVFLSLMVLRQKSIWGACAWHAGWNWVFIACFGLPTTGIALNVTPLVVNLRVASDTPEWLNGGSGGPENTVIALLVLVLGCVFLLRQRRRGREKGGVALRLRGD